MRGREESSQIAFLKLGEFWPRRMLWGIKMIFGKYQNSSYIISKKFVGDEKDYMTYFDVL